MKISNNFTLEELTDSPTAVRMNLSCTPSSLARANLYSLVNNVLQPLRDALGPVIVTSGYRSPELNKIIGGSPNSQHCLGQAADIRVLGKSVIEVCNYIDQSDIIYDQLIYEGTWVHVSYNKLGNRRNKLTAVFSNNKVSYIQGIPKL